LAYSKDEVTSFVEALLHNFNDYKFEQRTDFIKSYLMPPAGKTASETIFSSLFNDLR
jgi:hypothetical protein